jgi:DNA-binding MarR family transcriptional regulator
MSLENDIQQKFRNESQKAILNILYTGYYIQDRMNMLFKQYDITRQQYNVLRILRGQYPGHASVNLIRDRMLDKMSDASRIVERLRLKDLVVRKSAEKDKRAVRKSAEKDKRAVEVTITEAGLKLLSEMQDAVDQFESLLNNLSDEETRQLNQLLDRIRDGQTEKREAVKTEAALQ